MHKYLSSLTDPQRVKIRVDSERALRLAWPARHSLRGRIVVQSNVAMLRNLREV